MTSVPVLGDRVSAAYTDLREKILRLDLLPGEVISERDFEQMLGMSRSPIRDALIRLEVDGLVIRQRRGYQIAPINLDEFIQVFEYREAIEAVAARQACLKASTAELDHLQALLAQPLSPDSPDAWFHVSTEFHVALAELSGNRFFVSGINDALTRIARVRWMHTTNSERRVSGHQAHLDIMEALLARNPDKAAEATIEHVRNVRDDLVSFLETTERTLRGRGIRIR